MSLQNFQILSESSFGIGIFLHLGRMISNLELTFAAIFWIYVNSLFQCNIFGDAWCEEIDYNYCCA